MTLSAFVLACLALLIAPGPTNTLMALASAQGGMRRVLRFVPAELIAYLTAILLVGGVFAPVLATHPALATTVKLMAAAWVMALAVRLWSGLARYETSARITAGDIAVTTLLNPKVLVFGLVLLPMPGSEGFGLRLGLLAMSIIGVAILWGGFGRLLSTRQAGTSHLPRLQRFAALWLGILSLTMAVGVLKA